MPIFYDMSQSVVLEQKEIFAEALLNGPIDKVNNWRTALKEAANLPGLRLEPHRVRHECIVIISPCSTIMSSSATMDFFSVEQITSETNWLICNQ
uniref:TIR domain-containing protein n=1 Tax=Quercus lobata TaxID=97700 RepID=A0A7N2LG59_QUELO